MIDYLTRLPLKEISTPWATLKIGEELSHLLEPESNAVSLEPLDLDQAKERISRLPDSHLKYIVDVANKDLNFKQHADVLAIFNAKHRNYYPDFNYGLALGILAGLRANLGREIIQFDFIANTATVDDIGTQEISVTVSPEGIKLIREELQRRDVKN
jgi:hypothetical protein